MTTALRQGAVDEFRCARLEGGAQPLVSILIPWSNPRYFVECLDSALAQTYPHTEIVI